MIIFLLALVVVCSALQYWSMKHSLDGITHDHWPSRNLVEPGESFQIYTTIMNTTIRFVCFICVHERIPDGLILERETDRDYTLFLMPRRSWKRGVQIKASKRGRYILGGAELQGGDFLGISKSYVSFPNHKEIVVIPSQYDKSFMLETLGGFLGLMSVNRFIMEDPVLTMGFREYTGHEPFKMISWTQSARNMGLMVKKYDYTLEMVATVILDVECLIDKETEVLIEDCFSIARTVCETLEEKHIKYSFLTNAYTGGALSSWDNITDGLGKGHLMTILEGLGRASYGYVKSFSSLLNAAAKNAESGRSHIVIMPEYKEVYRHPISRLRELTGGKVLILTPEGEVVI